MAQSWTLTPPGGRFDASALVRLPDGRMLTVNDKETGLFEIQFPSSGTEAVLVPYAGLSPSLFEPLTPGRDLPWDVEGIGIDSTGALYLSEEHSRWILKQSAPGKPLERLPIDWSPASRWFSKTDRNASFEGVAVGDRFLYVANERDTGRILEVDRKTLRVVSDFQPRPPEPPVTTSTTPTCAGSTGNSGLCAVNTGGCCASTHTLMPCGFASVISPSKWTPSTPTSTCYRTGSSKG